MNNNISGIEFTLEDVENWGKSTINAIIEAIADDKNLVENHPN